MNKLQQWFERMAGMPPILQASIARAQAVFGAEELDERALATPACWRRPRQIHRLRNR